MTTPRTNRITVDLDPALLQKFEDWTVKTARANKVRRLAMTDALRAMITVTIEDPEMAAAVETELTATKWAPKC